jgi:ubiquinone/menaquinone biosynthesis C-methylase UbiE
MDIQEFCEHVASDWDTMRLANYDELVIEKMGEFSKVSGGSEVADVGMGTGFVAVVIAPRVKRVVGIDNTPALHKMEEEVLLERDDRVEGGRVR